MASQSVNLIYSDDQATVNAVQRVMESYSQVLDARARAELPRVITAVRELDETNPAVLVDLAPSSKDSLLELEQIIAMLPQARFVVLSDQADSGLLMEAMNIGVRYFVCKATLEEELPKILRRMQGGSRAKGSARGSLVTVLSAGGGCGATTLAVNLASELPRDDNEPALLIDMDESYGAIATYLGLCGTYGLAELLSYDDSDEVDPQLVSSTALKHSDSLHALINPVSVDFNEPTPLRFERLEAAIEACQQAYPWVVIDAPRVPVSIAARLAHMSRFTLIVGQLSVKDVRAARSIQNALVRQGVTPDSIRYVINRYRSKHSMLTIEDARNALGESHIKMIKNDFGSTIESINLGKTLSECAPRCGARRDIQRLASEVSTQSGNGHVSVLTMEH